eukprot:TRINITY_DN28484_c0_g1_i4.p1 TRINITY_DN28484_c0_g1~~TRINITY_DN28484_c0_g1_i4.p1  ORF type:complete len:326 (+),score=75.65 TRINITY_DN28484_c0_g1_i4:88-978(+)
MQRPAALLRISRALYRHQERGAGGPAHERALYAAWVANRMRARRLTAPELDALAAEWAALSGAERTAQGEAAQRAEAARDSAKAETPRRPEHPSGASFYFDDAFQPWQNQDAAQRAGWATAAALAGTWLFGLAMVDSRCGVSASSARNVYPLVAAIPFNRGLLELLLNCAACVLVLPQLVAAAGPAPAAALALGGGVAANCYFAVHQSVVGGSGAVAGSSGAAAGAVAALGVLRPQTPICPAPAFGTVTAGTLAWCVLAGDVLRLTASVTTREAWAAQHTGGALAGHCLCRLALRR